MYDLILGGGFVPPEVNEPLRLEGRTVIPDFRWPEQKLVIEADGARWHDNALARARRRSSAKLCSSATARQSFGSAGTRQSSRPGSARKRFGEAPARPLR